MLPGLRNLSTTLRGAKIVDIARNAYVGRATKATCQNGTCYRHGCCCVDSAVHSFSLSSVLLIAGLRALWLAVPAVLALRQRAPYLVRHQHINGQLPTPQRGKRLHDAWLTTTAGISRGTSRSSWSAVTARKSSASRPRSRRRIRRCARRLRTRWTERSAIRVLSRDGGQVARTAATAGPPALRPSAGV